MAEKSRLKVIQNDEGEVIGKTILAEAIVEISKAVEHLQKDGQINHRAIVVLLRDSTKLPKRDIEAVLNSLQSLEEDYVMR